MSLSYVVAKLFVYICLFLYTLAAIFDFAILDIFSTNKKMQSLLFLIFMIFWVWIKWKINFNRQFARKCYMWHMSLHYLSYSDQPPHQPRISQFKKYSFNCPITIDVKYWRLKSILALKELKKYNDPGPITYTCIGIQMKRKELTKTFMMTSNWNHLCSTI